MHEKNARTLALLIRLCDDLAWGRPADEDALFALTREGSSSPELERLAEAFGMMIVKVEAREFHRAELLEKVEQLSQELEKSRLRMHEENRQVVETLQKEYNVRRIIGRCPAMRQVVAQALAIARRPINTLILGPSGTGKEIFAKTIHYHSPRRDAPFVAVNCTAIPDSLFESEMFGIEKGVATGVSARRGLVEEASGGTLFLDELADMSLPNQAKLLRVLEEREVLRVGSARPVPVDIKVIAATNVDLRQAVARGRFREDLYYRLNVAELTLPPLRERGDDILLLARHLLAQHAHNMERAALTLAPATQQCLLAYDWPGNVRELSNEMERAAALTVDTVIRPSDLSPKLLAALARHGCIKTSATAPGNRCRTSGRHSIWNRRSACWYSGPSTPARATRAGRAELLGITREGLRKSCCASTRRPTAMTGRRHERKPEIAAGPAGGLFRGPHRCAGPLPDLAAGRGDHDRDGRKKFRHPAVGGRGTTQYGHPQPSGRQGTLRPLAQGTAADTSARVQALLRAGPTASRGQRAGPPRPATPAVRHGCRQYRSGG